MLSERFKLKFYFQLASFTVGSILEKFKLKAKRFEWLNLDSQYCVHYDSQLKVIYESRSIKLALPLITLTNK